MPVVQRWRAPAQCSTQKRFCTFPHEGGPGVYNETTDRPDLREQAIALLRRMKWHGPAQVEFKVGRRDQRPKLIEVNSRFWGTLDLAVLCRCEFPATGRTDGRSRGRGTGFSLSSWIAIPVAVALRRLVRLPGSSTVRCALWEFFGPAFGTRSNLWLTDPRPSLLGLVHTVRPRRYAAHLA